MQFSQQLLVFNYYSIISIAHEGTVYSRGKHGVASSAGTVSGKRPIVYTNHPSKPRTVVQPT